MSFRKLEVLLFVILPGAVYILPPGKIVGRPAVEGMFVKEPACCKEGVSHLGISMAIDQNFNPLPQKR